VACGVAHVSLFIVAAGCTSKDNPEPQLARASESVDEHIVARLGSTLYRPHRPCWAISVSPDGSKLATGSMPGDPAGVIEIWDAKTGQLLFTVAENCVNVIDLAWSNDGRLAASYDGRLELFDTTDGRLISRLETGRRTSESFWGVTLSRSADLISAFDSLNGDVGVWRTADWMGVLLQRADFKVTSVALTEDGKRIAVGGDKTLEVWDVSTGEIRPRMTPDGEVVALAASPGGKRFASVVLSNGQQECRIKTWDSESGRLVAESDSFTGTYLELSYAFDGKSIVSGGWTKEITVWDSETLERQRGINGDHRIGRKIAVARDAPVVVSADHRIGVWNLDGGSLRVSDDSHARYISSVVFTADDAKVITSAPDGMYFWDADTGERLNSFVEGGTGAWGVTISPNGQYIAAGLRGANVGLWDASGKYLATLSGLQKGELAAAARTLQFSADSKRLAAGGNGIAVWEVETKELVHSQRIDALIPHLHLTGKGDSVMYAVWGEGELRQLDLASGNDRLIASNTGYVGSHCFDLSPDSRHLATTWFSPHLDLGDIPTDLVFTAKVTGLAGEGTLFQFNQPTLKCAYRFSPNGELLASSADNVVELWSVKEQESIFVSGEHGNHVTCLTFSDDGKRLASSSQDCTVIIWDVDSMLQSWKDE
jgi:WD40 repeat protein